jgi:uncharacterized protein YqhQ
LSSKKKTSIGGSALIEGVMMRGPTTTAMAVRKPDGDIDLSVWKTGGGRRPWYKRRPIVRGVFNFFDSMKVSYQCLMKSAQIAGIEEEEEPSAFESRMKKIFGDRFDDVFAGLALALGAALAVGLFMVLPTLLIGFIRSYVQAQLLLSLIEAAVKIGIFVLYLYAVSRMAEIRRVFAYHGAEHKTIACYEAGEELTVENVARHSRFHPRCGTSFLLIVLIVSVLVFSVVTWDHLLMRIALKLLCLPLVVGIAYEIIKLAGRYDNLCTRWVSAPGLWLQRLTTGEPEPSQLEVAIAAMRPCIPEDGDQDRW